MPARPLRILSVVGKGYYGHAQVPEPLYLYFTDVPTELGHDVEHFDHVAAARELGVEGATAALDHRLAEGGLDLVLYQHAPREPEPIDTAVFRAHRERICIAAWNSDDDWQWYRTGPRAGDFTAMVTTYPQVYERERVTTPNLVLSQWGCYGRYAAPAAVRDIPFSFAGAVYWTRIAGCQRLRRRAGLECFGAGSRFVNLGIPPVRGMGRFKFLFGEPIDFRQINDVWNRTQVSYTPLSGSHGDVLSLKSRIFDMGLSGTVMLCEAAPHLDDYYEPGVEYVTFENLDDCAEKATWLLRDDAARNRIAEAYMARTRAEHLWSHRFTRLFDDLGLG